MHKTNIMKLLVSYIKAASFLFRIFLVWQLYLVQLCTRGDDKYVDCSSKEKKGSSS